MKEHKPDVEKTVGILKEFISGKGYDYIYDSAYTVYKALIKKNVDRTIAAATLYALVADTARKNKSDIKKEVAGKLFLNKEMSSIVSDIFSFLYDSTALWEMKKEEYRGLEEFLSTKWEIKSEGKATWQYKSGIKTDYSYTYVMKICVKDRSLVEKDLKERLKENPFLKAEDIRSYYEDKIDSIIRDDFVDYCTCDDYYPPVVEDFPSNILYNMEKFLPAHGLEMVDDAYDYHESDFYY